MRWMATTSSRGDSTAGARSSVSARTPVLSRENVTTVATPEAKGMLQRPARWRHHSNRAMSAPLSRPPNTTPVKPKAANQSPAAVAGVPFAREGSLTRATSTLKLVASPPRPADAPSGVPMAK